MEDNKQQKPATTNQIDMQRPNVPRSMNKLTGTIAGTMNGGHYRTIALREVMAGERIAIHGAQMYIQLQTPKTPAYQRLMAKVTAIMVPHSRVWDNYYKFKAQNDSNTATKIATMPNFGECRFPVIFTNDMETSQNISIQETTAWRDNIFSCYIERVGAGAIVENDEFAFNIAPPKSALGARGYVALYNDILRNREFDEERQEYHGDTVSENEWNSYMWNGTSDSDYYTGRTRRNNSYYTNYRTKVQGFDWEVSNENIDQTTLPQFAMNWAAFESKFAELRAEANAAQISYWDYAQSLSGAKKLTEGRCQVIASKTFPINYSAITQNAYNNNSEIEEKFRVMGMQGAFSYTEIDLAFMNGIEVVEDGYIHIIMTITADTVFESAVDRQSLNINFLDRYRPDLKDDKLDVLYECEYGTPYYDDTTIDPYSKILGFKRKYNEYFYLPNCLNGEVYNRGYYQTNPGTGKIDVENSNRIIPNNTYQFFEFAGQQFQDSYTLEPIYKKHWLDYTDLMINKNLAVMQSWYSVPDKQILAGPHQVVYFGKQYCVSDMPIDENIKNSFEKWGEH